MSDRFPEIDIRRAVEAASSGDSVTGESVTVIEDGLSSVDSAPMTSGMDIFGDGVSEPTGNTVFELVRRAGSQDPTQYTVKHNRLYFGRKMIYCQDADVTFHPGGNYVCAKIDHSSVDLELSIEVKTLEQDMVSTLSITYRMLYYAKVTVSDDATSVDIVDYRFIPQIPAYVQ